MRGFHNTTQHLETTNTSQDINELVNWNYLESIGFIRWCKKVSISHSAFNERSIELPLPLYHHFGLTADFLSGPLSS